MVLLALALAAALACCATAPQAAVHVLGVRIAAVQRAAPRAPTAVASQSAETHAQLARAVRRASAALPPPPIVPTDAAAGSDCAHPTSEQAGAGRAHLSPPGRAPPCTANLFRGSPPRAWRA